MLVCVGWVGRNWEGHLGLFEQRNCHVKKDGGFLLIKVRGWLQRCHDRRFAWHSYLLGVYLKPKNAKRCFEAGGGAGGYGRGFVMVWLGGG